MSNSIRVFVIGALHTAAENSRQVLDMPKLFKGWSQLGISDDDLKFLPIQMCSVSSARFVKCKFASNLSFKHFFTNISCTADTCFAFLSRITSVDNNRNNVQSVPSSMPFPIPTLTASSN